MPRTKPTLAALANLELGQYADCFAQLVERSRNATRDGKAFMVCRFRDSKRTVSVTVWSDGALFQDCTECWQVGRCYKLRGHFFEHEKYGLQFELEQIRETVDADRADGFDPLAMVERTGYDTDELLASLRGLVAATISDGPLRRLVELVLDRHVEALLLLPGSANKYFPFAGGWLEHTLSVTHKCLLLADLYRTQYPELNPPLNRDLVVACAVLHDIGRVGEFADPLSLEPSIPGKLVGHLILGRDIVRDVARDVPDLNPELLQLLEHLLLSYLAIPEWGSARLPCIPECLILHHADDLDAKMEMYVRCLTRDRSPGPFTDRDAGLGKSLLKKRST